MPAPVQPAQSVPPAVREAATAEQVNSAQVTDQKAEPQKRPAQRFGLRVDDPEEYAKLIQPKPERPTPRPQGLRDKSSKDSE